MPAIFLLAPFQNNGGVALKKTTIVVALLLISLLPLQSIDRFDSKKLQLDIPEKASTSLFAEPNYLDPRQSFSLRNGNSFSIDNGTICWIETQGEKILCSQTNSEIDSRTIWDFDIGLNLISLEVVGDTLCVLTSRFLVTCNSIPSPSPSNSKQISTNGNWWNVDFSNYPVRKIVGNSGEYCALTFGGTVGCWNHKSVLYEDSESLREFIPKKVLSLGIPVDSIFVQENFYCAILSDKSVNCEKISNHSESMFLEKIDANLFPKQISEVAMSDNEFCVLNMSGSISCALISELSAISHNSGVSSESVFSLWLEDAYHISSSKENICAVSLNGTLFCRGNLLLDGHYSASGPISLSKDALCFTHSEGNDLSCMEVVDGTLIELNIDAYTTVNIIDSDYDGVIDSLDYYPSDNTSSMICPEGHYGRHTCVKAEPGFYSPVRNLFSPFPCNPGEYQNLYGSTECKMTPPGTYSESFAMNAPTKCPAGTYSQQFGKSDSKCIEASPGNWTKSGSSNQIACPLGTFQPSPGQSECLLSEYGFFVSKIGQNAQTECSPGTFQSLRGQSECIPSNPGFFVSKNASIAEQPCPPGSFSNSSGNIDSLSCLISEPGHFVDSPGSSFQTKCPAGTFNPNHGSISQISCELSQPGYYSLAGSSAPEPCPPGTYQSFSGQSFCEITEKGSFTTFGASSATPCPTNHSTPGEGSSSESDCVSSPGYYQGEDSPEPCAPGTFQPLAGQDECIVANPGYFVSAFGSASEEPCPIGSWNQSPGSFSIDSCTPCPTNHSTPGEGSSSESDCVSSPGYYQGEDSPEPCAPGTFQPLAGQDECIVANPGYFVSAFGSASEEPCPIGTFNPTSGADSISSCLDVSEGAFANEGSANQTFASPGFFVSLENLGAEMPCPSGTFNPKSGSYSDEDCLSVPEGTYAFEGASQPFLASAGYFVQPGINHTQVPCPAGSYNPTIGSTSEGSCILAGKGHFVENNGSKHQIPCPAGTYNNETGSKSPDACLLVPRGHFSLSASSHPEKCNLGEYQDEISSQSCKRAPPGHFVDSMGAVFPTPCSAGSFQPNNGSTTCINANPGFIAPEPSMSHAIPCPVGFFQPNYGSDQCLASEPGYFSPIPGQSEQTPCPSGTFQISHAQSSCELPNDGHFLIPGISESEFPCPPGSFSNSNVGEMAFSCRLSPVGFSSPGAVSHPLPCEMGSFSEVTGSSFCTLAKPGYYVDEVASSKQKECLIGHFQDETGSIMCKEAPIGFFVDTLGSNEPTPCPSKSSNFNIGSTSTSCIMDSDLDGISDLNDRFALISFNLNNSPILILLMIINSLIWVILQSQVNWGRR